MSSPETDVPTDAPVLQVRDLTVRFGAVVALKGVDMAIRPNEVVAVIGPNGSGKTTLLNCVSGFVRPAGGTIALHGAPVEHLRAYERARLGVGRTFQHARLVDDLSARANVLAAARWTTRPTALFGECLRLPSWRARMSEQADSVEDLLDRCGIPPEREGPAAGIPFGQRKLVDLARALAGGPRLLLMDEPTAGLSDPEVRTLASMLRTRTDGMAMLIVAHHMGFVAEVADRVVCLQEGTVIADGNPAEVQADPRVVAAYVGTSS